MTELINVYSTPRFQDFNIEGVEHIHPQDAYAFLKSGVALLLDVREKSEVNLEEADIKDVVFHPMSVIMDRIKHIPADRPVFILSTSGIQSVKVANLLIRQGFKDVVNIDGGLMLWKAFGLPFSGNIKSSGCCNCSCKNCD